MSKSRYSPLIRGIILKMALSSFLIQAIALYSSEFFNSLFNNRYDSLNLSLLERIPLIFKPTILLVFIGAYIFQLSMMLTTLRPMFDYLRDGSNYLKARTAAVKLPWRLLFIQTGTWFLGTSAYFILRGGDAESGIPYALSVLLKLSIGFIGTLYNCIFVNIHLLPAKRALAITDIKPGERDRFMRNKDFLLIASSSFLIVIHFFYLSYYLINPHSEILNPYLVVGLWCLYFISVSLVLAWLSRYENNCQMRFLKEHIGRLLDSSAGAADSKVQLLYFDEVGEFAALFNLFLDKFRSLLDQITNSALLVSNSVQELSTTTKEVTTTSNMQAAAVKEVVSTMEDSNTITQSIGKSISEVTRIAMRTKGHVDSGTEIVQGTTDKMLEIRKKNTDTISGIRSLTDKIRAIWDIVDIINTIVEQTRIIAFNAALEASTAGEAGNNFRIVAGEIKRLADSTSQSTAEIQSRIMEIQKAANNLIVVSEEGTERIRQGHELSDKLHAVFSDILASADISATSSESIERSIRQQAAAFEQILVTMKEISRGIDNLLITQQQTAHTAESLSGMAGGLEVQAKQFALSGRGD